jgi:surface-anchored protein
MEIMLLLIVAGLWAFSGPATAFGQVILTDQLVDLGVTFENGTWDFVIRDDPHQKRYDPDEVIFFAGSNAIRTQTSDPRFAFLGTGAGNPVWIFPQILNPTLVTLGISMEEIDPGTFATYFEADPRINRSGEWITVTLEDVRGPGQFSLWQTSGFGNPTVWMSTFTGAKSFITATGSDNHLNWGFTAAGDYEVDLRASAFLGPGMTNQTKSEVVTLHFSIAPEPSTAGLLALGGVLLGGYLRSTGRKRTFGAFFQSVGR